MSTLFLATKDIISGSLYLFSNQSLEVLFQVTLSNSCLLSALRKRESHNLSSLERHFFMLSSHQPVKNFHCMGVVKPNDSY